MGTVSENPSILKVTPASPKHRRFAVTFSRNAAARLARLFVSSLVGLALPAFLTHHLPVKTYGAWVLILQLSAYVSYLDFGVQTGVAKYVAEHEAKADQEDTERCASVGFAILLFPSLRWLNDRGSTPPTAQRPLEPVERLLAMPDMRRILFAVRARALRSDHVEFSSRQVPQSIANNASRSQ